MSRGYRPGEQDEIYKAAMNVKAQRETNLQNRRKHGTYDMKTKGEKVSEDDALTQIQDGLRLTGPAEHTKIWHAVEGKKGRDRMNDPGISDILGVLEVPVQSPYMPGSLEIFALIRQQHK